MKNHLQFNWWKYLIIMILPIIVWCGIFDALAAPKPNEKVSILFIGEALDSQKLQQELWQVLPQRTEQPLREITVETALPREAAYQGQLTAWSLQYDIIIIPKDYMRQFLGQSVFVRLTQEMLRQFPAVTPYEEFIEDGTSLPFGLTLFDGTQQNRFAGCYADNQACYLFISPYSVNFNTLNEAGKAGDDAALQAVLYLLEMT